MEGTIISFERRISTYDTAFRRLAEAHVDENYFRPRMFESWLPHSKFISAFRHQFEESRLQNYGGPMRKAGFVIGAVMPTRKQAYPVVCRKPP